MSGLPKGWVETRLADVCHLQNGRAYKQEELLGSGKYRVLRVGNFFTSNKWYYSDLELEATKYCDKGDLLYAWSASFGPQIWSGEKVIFHYHIWRVDLETGKFDRDFVFHWFNWDKENIKATHGAGSTMIHVTKGDMEQRKISLPPIAEQKRIVAKLDALSTKSARARTELARIETLVSRYKQAVLRTAFNGKLTSTWRDQNAELESALKLISRTLEPPKSRGGRDATETVIEGKAALSINRPAKAAPPLWTWVPLSRVARQETGHTPSRSRPDWWDGDVPWIGIKDAGLHHGKVISRTFQTTNAAGLANSAARLLPAGTVCLSRTASVGYVTVMGKPMATSQDFVTWTCTPALSPQFLMYALMAEGDDIREFGKGTTHTTIYFPEVRAMQICLAPLEEQHEIVRRIESAFARIGCLAAEAKRALALLGRLDEAILAKAFRGELVPQDENDEPASVLLDRIRAERAAAPKQKRGRKAKA